MLVVFGAIVGVPVAAVAYFFLKLVAEMQQYVFETLPGELGFDSQPSWWSIPFLALSGLIVAASIRFLPGTSGHKPAEGFKTGGAVRPIDLPGIILASFATLSLGVVLGPEAPLIAIGSGMGVLAVHLIKRDAPQMASVVIGAAGSFAAISTLLGSPLAGAFLLMEAGGLGGALMSVVLVPGLLAAGIGSLIYIGLDDWTGFGTFSLAVPDIPPAGSPTGAEFLWAIAIGVLAAILGTIIRRLALALQPIVAERSLVLTPLAGVGIGVLVLIFVEATDKSSANVLFSGQDQLPALIEGAATWSVGALLLLVLCKGARLLARAERVPRRPRLPGHVHRCRRRDRALASPRALDDRGCRDGHRCDDRCHARPAARRPAARDPVPAGGRPAVDAARDRRDRGLVHRLGAARARAGASRPGATRPRRACENMAR